MISLGLLDMKGYSFSATAGILKVSRGDGVGLQGKRIGRLYKLQGSVVTVGATVNRVSNSTVIMNNERGAMRSQKCTQYWRKKDHRAQSDSQAQIRGSKGVQKLQEVQWKAQSNGPRSCLKSCTTQATITTRKRVVFAQDIVSDDYTSRKMPTEIGEVESQFASR